MNRKLVVAAAAISALGAAAPAAFADEHNHDHGNTWCEDHEQENGPYTETIHEFGAHSPIATEVYFLVEPVTCA